jgi:ABC-2 type transport system ATP-binding protein
VNILEIRNLTKKFNDVIAVDNMSLNVAEGEIFGFLGPNGAGKSTTISMIASLLRITKGEILLLGKNIVRHPKFAKSNIGLVPQDIAIYEDMSAYENVKFFAGLYGLRGALLEERTQEALSFVELADKQKTLAKNYSGGMKRRLNIACAIAHRPKLIIMDEPTVGIDPHSRNYILNAVKQLNEMGCTIIYTSHYMEEVEEICTRIAIIDNGKIIADGTKEQLKSIITDTKEIWIGVKDAAAEAVEALKDIPGVLNVRLEEKKIKMVSRGEVNNLSDILRLLMERQIEIRSVEEQAPDLETVFLTLTGRKLRD